MLSGLLGKCSCWSLCPLAEKEHMSRTFPVRGMWQQCWRQGSLKFAVPEGGCFFQETPVPGSASSWGPLWAGCSGRVLGQECPLLWILVRFSSFSCSLGAVHSSWVTEVSPRACWGLYCLFEIRDGTSEQVAQRLWSLLLWKYSKAVWSNIVQGTPSMV